MRIAVRVGCAVLAGAVTTGVVAAAPASAGQGPRGHRGVQAVLERAVAEGRLPGAVAEVREENGRRWFGAAGVADTGTGRDRHRGDRFRIGSTTKTFVATVVLQLVAEHRLGLDDTVEQWLPGLLDGNGYDGRSVTVRQLLNNTSGVFNYVLDDQLRRAASGTAFLEHRFDTYRPQELVRIAVRNGPAFAPGTDWGYSDTNYVIAGMIVEKATGGSLGEEIERRITRPLGLRGTYQPAAGDTAIHGPHGREYSRLMATAPGADAHDVTELDPSWAWATGDMVSTVEDLNTFFGALLAGRLLPAAQQREMFATLPTRGQWIPDTTYGLGVASITLPCGPTVWGMGGAIPGSWSYTFGTRDGRHLLSTNVNGDWADGTWTMPNPIGVFTAELEAEFCPTD
ncbi:serine hydrolase domain-containing protein [Kitasatospora camelliae]|uniref:Serine hydrolase domain-containing protein n=1 Tax=Kitasatospora camelliae TaxID=3156397 RepID=A0AAU8JSM6_9ACTN